MSFTSAKRGSKEALTNDKAAGGTGEAAVRDECGLSTEAGTHEGRSLTYRIVSTSGQLVLRPAYLPSICITRVRSLFSQKSRDPRTSGIPGAPLGPW